MEQEKLPDKDDRGKTRRIMIASVVGNVLEWYDFGVFAFLAPQIGLFTLPVQLHCYVRHNAL